MEELKNKIEELAKAKNNVKICLEDSDILIDFHGIVYWAERVEKLRKEIKEML